MSVFSAVETIEAVETIDRERPLERQEPEVGRFARSGNRVRSER
jgi:hypothetical protein